MKRLIPGDEEDLESDTEAGCVPAGLIENDPKVFGKGDRKNVDAQACEGAMRRGRFRQLIYKDRSPYWGNWGARLVLARRVFRQRISKGRMRESLQMCVWAGGELTEM